MKNIYVVDDNDDFFNKITNIFKKEIGIKIFKIKSSKLNEHMENIVDVFIISEDNINNKKDIFKVCRLIREDVDNSKTPIVVIPSNDESEHKVKILKEDVELCLSSDASDDVIYYSIINLIRLLNSNRMVSPLTGLPGNIQIQAEMKERLESGKKFAMLYLDLDNFKAYNDTYGFSNGDEVIKYTARLISKFVMEDDDSNFVGHIGGDDFIAIVQTDNYESICQNIIATFDREIGKFFTREDRERGFIEVENRKGIMEQFPIISISIGVVEVTQKRFNNPLEIGEAGAAVKHLAKTIWGSTYVIDRRKNPDKLTEAKKITRK